MIRILKIVFLFVALVLSSSSTKANHFAGSHIGYNAIDSTTYEVILTLYIDCYGTLVNNPKIKVTGKSSGIFITTPHLVSTTDITGAYLKCNFISRCNGTGQYGFKKLVYKDTVDVSEGACQYKFSYEECCRNSYTGHANTRHYNYALVNKCLGMNNSVQADIEPSFLLPVGQDVSMAVFAGDRIDKTDSVVYSLVEVYSDSVTKVLYSGQWSPKRPISFLGFPNTSLSLPAGFHFESNTSDLRFRPIIQNQVSVFCVEAKEYKRINGKLEVAGITRMEHIVLVVAANNKTPRIKGQSTRACSNQEVCMEFETEDDDNNDSTFLDFVGLPQGATVTYGRKGRLATAKLCWTPTDNDISNIPKQFVVIATDNSCTISSRTSRSFNITTRLSPDTSTFEVISKTSQCSSAEIKLNMKNKSLPGLSIYYIDEDSISYSQLFQPRLYFKGNGWKKFHISLTTSTPCTYIHTDSVFITPQYSLQFNTKNDTSVCKNDSVTIFTHPINGTAPYKYFWPRNNPYIPIDTNIFKTIVDRNKHLSTVVADSNNCIGFTDTIFLTAKPLPVINAGQNDSVCPNAIFSLTATHDSTMQTPHFNWQGINTLQTVSTQTPANKWYYVTATSAQGCTYIDSTLRSVHNIGVDAGSYPTLCSNMPIQLAAKSVAGLAPYKYRWLNTGDSTTILNITPTKDTSYIIQIEDAKGCFSYDTAKINAYALPTFTIPNDTFICKGDSIVLSATNINAAQPYQFKVNAVIADSVFIHSALQPERYVIELLDANSCKTYDSVFVNVFNKPTVSVSTDKTVCKGTEVLVISDPLGGKAPYKYQWTNGQTNKHFKAIINTKEILGLRVTDANGCFVVNSVTYDTFPTQKAILTPIANPFCDDAPPVGLKSIPNTGIWTGAGVSGKIFNPKTAGAGIHPLTFSFTSIHNCPEQGELLAVVKQTPQPDFTVDKNKGVPNTQFSFSNQTIADTTYTSEWNMGDGSSLLTTQNVNHTYTNIGTYTVTLKVGNGICPVQSITKSNIIAIDSIIDFIPNTEKQLLNIFPNPANDVLNITSDREISEVILVNLLGKEVIHETNNINSLKVNIARIPNGVYLLSVKLANGTIQNTKLLITH